MIFFRSFRIFLIWSARPLILNIYFISTGQASENGDGGRGAGVSLEPDNSVKAPRWIIQFRAGGGWKKASPAFRASLRLDNQLTFLLRVKLHSRSHSELNAGHDR